MNQDRLPGTVRQLIVTGLGRNAPTVIITHNDQLSVRALIEHYARRMTIEERLAESSASSTTRSPSASTGAPVHPRSARPTYPTTPRAVGGNRTLRYEIS